MLIETKSITEIAKYYGSTWLVTSFVIISILIMAFIANLLIIKKIKIFLAKKNKKFFKTILCLKGSTK